jgi:hypothetical protein
LASMTPKLANALGRFSPTRAVANALLHIQPERTLPEFADSTFRSRVKRRQTTGSKCDAEVSRDFVHRVPPFAGHGADAE